METNEDGVFNETLVVAYSQASSFLQTRNLTALPPQPQHTFSLLITCFCSDIHSPCALEEAASGPGNQS